MELAALDRAYHLDPTGTSASGSSIAPGKRTLTMSLPGVVQRKVALAGDVGPGAIDEAAARGIATTSDAMPHRDTVQAAFGRHRLDHVQSHSGEAAAATAHEMNAEAYAVGDHVVFGGNTPSLHTVAHEAAHVIQQRAGVARKGGGDLDAFEHHADAVADAVVAGRSAEALLDEVAAPAGAPSPTVQRIVKVDGVQLDVIPESKGPQAAQVLQMHRSQKSIYNFKSAKHLVDYMNGKGKGPVIEDNPAYDGGDGDAGAGKKKKRKAEAEAEAEAEDEDAEDAPLFERNLTLMTNYVRLSISGSAPRSLERDFTVTMFKSMEGARPPVEALNGRQGQHKVAWRAIWGALERCTGKTLAQAHTTMDEIIAIGAPDGLAEQKPLVNVVGGARPTPDSARTLLLKGHNYLVARQNDDPAWESKDRDQLKGKGERGLDGALARWQTMAAGTSGATVRAFFASTNIHKLFDATGRQGDEVDDVVARARRELQLHNPTAFAEHTDDIDAWLTSQRPDEADEEAEAS